MQSTQNVNDTLDVKKFVDDFYKNSIDGIYYAHQPIYGYRTKYAEPAHIGRYMITRSLLDNLARYKFSEVMDISAAEGYTSNIIKKLFGAKVRTTDLAESVCKVAHKIFGLDAQVADILDLPFKDNEFEVVICSETLEHVPNWEKGLDELIRITEKLLIVTVPHDTLEFVEYNRAHVPGGHINHFEDTSFDFLIDRGLKFYIEKSSCPKLIKPRVLVEAYKKDGPQYKFYNMLTPIFKTIFGIKTANWLVDIDKKMIEKTKQYGGITLVIEKRDIEKNKNYKPIKAQDFTNITVPHFLVKNLD